MKIANATPNLSFREKRGISPSPTERLEKQILSFEAQDRRFAQDDNLHHFHPLGCRRQTCMRDSYVAR